ncbi:hypothetical protein NC652_016402 [Populus alba x Populus x berolinensis]|nr:hypothetical protein NC652_016402 [Populus alba x Populus x berolinensis]
MIRNQVPGGVDVHINPVAILELDAGSRYYGGEGCVCWCIKRRDHSSSFKLFYSVILAVAP